MIVSGNISEFIKMTARSVGFDACGIAPAEALEDDAIFLRGWLDEGCHGKMSYLERNFDKRTDPRLLVEGCRSVVVVLMNYFTETKRSVKQPRIARYAWSKVDYHDVVRAKLRELENEICRMYGSEVVAPTQHVFVDSAPVLERRWAQKAGLGWLGKHTQLIHPGLGSYCFIGVLMLNVEADYDQPIASRCGNCTRCIQACPTGALSEGRLDARRCISYLTIEDKSLEMSEDLKSKLSGCLLGCDICADVCPWNKKWAVAHCHPELSPVEELLSWQTNDWSVLSKSDFSRLFGKSALQRAGFEKLQNNLESLESGKSE